MSEADFAGDQRTVDAVLRNLMVIGEAARHVPEPAEIRYPNIPWTQMRGLRNVVAHEYDRVSLEVVWNTVQIELPPLILLLKAAGSGKPGRNVMGGGLADVRRVEPGRTFKRRGVVLLGCAVLALALTACGEGDDDEEFFEEDTTATAVVAAPADTPAPSPTRSPASFATEAPADPTATPVPSPSPAPAGAAEIELPLFSVDSPFNRPIGDSPVIDPANEAMVQTLISDGEAGFVVSVKDFTAPVYVADDSTARHDVTIRCGPEWEVGVSTLANVPIPDGAEPSAGGGAVNPDVCGQGDDEGDYHLVVIDPVAGCQYEFWQAKQYADGHWEASWGNAIPLDSTGIYPNGMSSRGSGIAFSAGVIWPEELQAGRIEHALAFNYSSVKAGGPVAPATDSDGAVDIPGAIPEGARVQLDPSLDLEALGLTDYERTIARALQEYGMFLVDSGGAEGGISVYAVDPKSYDDNPYAGAWPDEEYVSLGGIPADSFRVLEMGPQDPEPELDPGENRCTEWR